MNVPYADLRRARRYRDYYRNMWWITAASWMIGGPATHYHWSPLVGLAVTLGVIVLGLLFAITQRLADDERDKELGL